MDQKYRRLVVAESQTLRPFVPRQHSAGVPLEEVFMDLPAVNDLPDGAGEYSVEQRRLTQRLQRKLISRSEYKQQMHALRKEQHRRVLEGDTRNATVQRHSVQTWLSMRGMHSVVLLGDPGSGKTTLLRYFALKSAQEQCLFSEQTPRLPLFISLSSFANFLKRMDSAPREVSLQEYVVAHYHGKHPGLSDSTLRALFAHYFARGSVLVLLDGLDEVTGRPSSRRVARRASKSGPPMLRKPVLPKPASNPARGTVELADEVGDGARGSAGSPGSAEPAAEFPGSLRKTM